ncbi:IS91 family transposase [Pontibacter virosus]|uniref:Transposase-like zinc-binding protein n=1 Tax=Pontibacter virosus TaxID=1765052 RepID=A0A2U1AGQ6_9BACT|nr:IS91 family transposase [Pontibacter virosus]PVY35593.1 transposase-like zinc-binding protein [Pontibacter virosus]
MRPRFEVAQVLQKHWSAVESSTGINSWQLRTLGAIMRCRTQAMGGHVDACSDCGQVRVSYNSCRNRHCPKCQGRKREQWIQARQAELLPVPYFHVVFTLPDTLNQLALHQPRLVYDTLFEAAWQTLLAFARDKKHLGARPGMVAVLHTWGQTLSLHPHLHCIVPGGGLTKHGNWKGARGKGKYLFPVKAMSQVYRAKYVQLLKEKLPTVEKELLKALFGKQWAVYAKRPFPGPEHVVEYLGRYTHKIAISNHRLTAVDEQSVSFSYKDYRQGAKKLEMKLGGMAFIRRFALHILPKGFVRIRHYGILSGTSKGYSIPVIREQLPEGKRQKVEVRQLEVYNPLLCPCCKKETMVTLQVLTKRGPPQGLRTQRRNREFE